MNRAQKTSPRIAEPKETPLQIARAAWGEGIPTWVEALAVECSRSTQKAVAQKLNRSAAVISNVLRNKYEGSVSAIEELFMGAFLNIRVECPELGLLPVNECQHWRHKGRSFASGNPLRVRMFRACTHCPRNRVEAQDE